MNTTRALARIIIAADRAGLPDAVMADLWAVRQLTHEGQREAIARWHDCMTTWPAAS